MPRTPRLDFPGARHHVTSRFLRKEHRLVDRPTRSTLLTGVSEMSRRYGLRVHAYAVMASHYHLLIESPYGTLSDGMRYLGTTLGRGLNDLDGLDGPVFRGRFHNRVVESDPYWQHLIAYVHLNPVEAGVVDRPEEAEWTSHRAYMGLVEPPDWLVTDELLAHHGGSDGLAAYIEGVRLNRIGAPEGFSVDPLPSTTATLRPRATAETDERFVSLEQAIDEVYRATGLPEQAFERSRGSRNPAAWVLAWWLTERTLLTRSEIASSLGVSKTRVSQLRRQAISARATDDIVRWWMADLEALLCSKAA